MNVGHTLSNYLSRPPMWRDTVIRAQTTAKAEVCVRLHAGFFVYQESN